MADIMGAGQMFSFDFSLDIKTAGAEPLLDNEIPDDFRSSAIFMADDFSLICQDLSCHFGLSSWVSVRAFMVFIGNLLMVQIFFLYYIINFLNGRKTIKILKSFT